MLRAAFLVAVALLFASCLGLEVETRFNADGSGTMRMTMRVSKAVLEMGEDGGDSGFDIPLSREDILSEFEGAEGIELIEVTEEETDEDLILTSVIEFESFDALLEAENSPVETASLRKKNGRTVFSMAVGEAGKAAASSEESPLEGQEMDDAVIAMIQAFLEGYYLEYRVTAPKKVTRYSHGELSENGRTVSLRVPMADYFVLDEPYVFEVEW